MAQIKSIIAATRKRLVSKSWVLVGHEQKQEGLCHLVKRLKGVSLGGQEIYRDEGKSLADGKGNLLHPREH